MNIFVGHLAREVTEADLRKVFEPFGQVVSATWAISGMHSVAIQVTLLHIEEPYY
jgi:hypothetical protein